MSVCGGERKEVTCLVDSDCGQGVLRRFLTVSVLLSSAGVGYCVYHPQMTQILYALTQNDGSNAQTAGIAPPAAADIPTENLIVCAEAHEPRPCGP